MNCSNSSIQCGSHFVSVSLWEDGSFVINVDDDLEYSRGNPPVGGEDVLVDGMGDNWVRDHVLTDEFVDYLSRNGFLGNDPIDISVSGSGSQRLRVVSPLDDEVVLDEPEPCVLGPVDLCDEWFESGCGFVEPVDFCDLADFGSFVTPVLFE